VPLFQLEPAARVVEQASAHGAGPFILVAFGLLAAGLSIGLLTLTLGHLGKREKASDERAVARDREHREALEAAYSLVREQNQSRLEETRELARCTQAGLNGALVSIRETNAELIRGFEGAIREIKPVIAQSNAAIARAELVMSSFVRTNGHLG